MQADSQTLNVTVYPKFHVPEVTQLPGGIAGVPYSVQLNPVGGVAPYSVQVTNLPAGLTCSPAGLVSGTPTAAGDFAPIFNWSDSTPV